VDTGVDEDSVVFHRIDNKVWESFQQGAPRVLADQRMGEREAKNHILSVIEGVNEFSTETWLFVFIIVESFPNIIGCLRLND
jgi:hypothetical protein